jgi:lysophospholipid acyltransferase (LPLAT)-like uncharacterized protein
VKAQASSKRGEIRGDRKSALLGTLAGWVMRLLATTLRLEIRDHCGISNDPITIQPAIYILWHNRFFVVPPAWNRICLGLRKTVALTSASKDGAMVAAAMAVFGLDSIRGSSSRRAVAALVGLKRALKDGFDVCLTPDGPRGPRYKVQPGFLKLAESTGAPIIPIHLQFSNAWRLKTWDRFVIPKPFSRVIVTFDKPITIPRGLDDAAFESERLKLENILIVGTDDA